MLRRTFTATKENSEFAKSAHKLKITKFTAIIVDVAFKMTAPALDKKGNIDYPYAQERE